MHDLGKGFTKLSASERLSLTLAAAARRDTSEVRRLVRSCPRLTGSIADPAYTHKLQASRRVALVWALMWEHAYRDYLVVCLRTPMDYAPRCPDDDLICKAAALLASAYLGLHWFCEGAGLDAEHLVQAWCSWLEEPTQTFLSTDPFSCLNDDSELRVYADILLKVAGSVEQALKTEWADD